MDPQLLTFWRIQRERMMRLRLELRLAMATIPPRPRRRRKDVSRQKKQRIPKQLSLFD